MKGTHEDLQNQIYWHLKQTANDWYRKCPDKEFDVTTIEEDLVAITQPYLQTLGWENAEEEEVEQAEEANDGDFRYFNEPRSEDEDVLEEGMLTSYILY